MMVSDVMTKNPLYAHPDLTLPDARNMMKKERVKRLLVLDGHNKMVGIITERDIVNAAPSSATSLSVYEVTQLLDKITVGEVMTKNVITVDENEVVEEAARVMVDNDISALPVMRGAVPVGIVSDGDIFRFFITIFGARQPGVRLSLLVPERKGELHALAEAIADKGGNVTALVVCEGCDVTNKSCMIKVTDLDRDTLLGVVKPLAIEILDIR